MGFFAPHAAYASASDPQGCVAEFKGMVRLLHEAGLEVILDVVYNHTCEQGGDGATLSLRGLDNRAYYRLDWQGRDVDVTGCGNTARPAASSARCGSPWTRCGTGCRTCTSTASGSTWRRPWPAAGTTPTTPTTRS